MGSEPICPGNLGCSLSPSSTKDHGLYSRGQFPPIMFHHDIYPPSKDYMSQPTLYVRQPCSLQIIQLVECSPPPPQQNKYSPSRLSSSSYSDSHDDSSAYDSSSSSLSAASSYCSSAEDSAHPVPPSLDNRDPSLDDTYHTRQRRVSLWRDAVYSKNAAPSGSSFLAFCFFRGGLFFFRTPASARPASPPPKRKTPDGDLANSDSAVGAFPSWDGHASFHPLAGFLFTDTDPSRQTSSHTPPRKASRSTPSAHSCPACDEDFSSPLSLRQHASPSRNANEACRIAVEYGFE